ncbi:3-phosphoshikimate 1-carboxyvinyltransferase [Dendrosporobacter sp. 1207_IL3150]|uniref:3-phosphoshikimate 1-carboxyvinyltransferase n=1 Tax=Dendrosporobacter sp. 1207_IL3150 TaxID=3084054 RepID=UPI002FD87F48
MGEALRINQKTGLKGTINIPGDKSISHRSVMFSSLAKSPVRIKNFLYAQDCLSTVSCMRALGAKIENDNEDLLVQGQGLNGLQEPEDILDAGNSGTTLRLLMGILAAQPFYSAFTGDASLRKRPMGRVITPLTKMGAKITARRQSRFLPLSIAPVDKLTGIHYNMPMASAQVKSAVLLAGMFTEGSTTVTEPYVSRDHTEKMFETFGVKLNRSGTSVTINHVNELTAPEVIDVPGDISSAAFWLVAASIIPGSELTLSNVGINQTRTGILDVLKQMGANIKIINERWSGKEPVADILVKSAELAGVSIEAEIIPRLVDEIPVLTVAAMFAKGETRISGAEELRVKETDRIKAIATEFTKMGGVITETADGLIIQGSADVKSAACYSYHDHRIAMALAIAGAAGQGVEIQQPDCVDISYPNFYETLDRLNS